MIRLACTCPSCNRGAGNLTFGMALLAGIVGLAAMIAVLQAYAPPVRHSQTWHWAKCMIDGGPDERRMAVCDKSARDFCHENGCTRETLGPY